jgi:hypothetical protein
MWPALGCNQRSLAVPKVSRQSSSDAVNAPTKRPPLQLECIDGHCVVLSWRKLAIFNAIRDAGEAGLSLAQIRAAVWKNGPVWQHESDVTLPTVAVHIRQLGAILAETGLRLVASGRGYERRWRLVKTDAA